MNALIEVKQSHIDSGSRQSVQCCPIALALKEHFKCDEVFVGGSCCSIGKTIFLSEMTKDCINFIRKFDRGEPVKPFNFFLKVIA